jgi:hypothetical protein
MRLALAFGAALLAAGTALNAQTDKAAKKPQPSARELHAKAAKTCDAIRRKAPADPMKGDPGRTEASYRDCMQREMCARAKDKKGCQERVAAALARQEKAQKACSSAKSKGIPAHEDCMRRELCAGAKDPARCETRTRAIRTCEPLESKTDAYRDCMRRELCTQAADPARCQETARAREACRGKKGDEMRACIQEQRGKKK